MINHVGTKEINTERLLLRKYVLDDVQDMFCNWANDSDVTKYLSWKPHGNIEITKAILNDWINEYQKPNIYNWAICFKETNEVIGSISVVGINEKTEIAEIGYCISKKYWNKGIMTEALKGVINLLVTQVGFNRIQALHYTENPASGKVMQKSGMKFEGTLRHYLRDNNDNYVDCNIYSILKNEINN